MLDQLKVRLWRLCKTHCATVVEAGSSDLLGREYFTIKNIGTMFANPENDPEGKLCLYLNEKFVNEHNSQKK